jgi:hypothetical protein
MNDLDSARIVPLFLAIMILASDVLIVLGLQYRGHSLWEVCVLAIPRGQKYSSGGTLRPCIALPMRSAFAFARASWYRENRGDKKRACSG